MPPAIHEESQEVWGEVSISQREAHINARDAGSITVAIILDPWPVSRKTFERCRELRAGSDYIVKKHRTGARIEGARKI